MTQACCVSPPTAAGDLRGSGAWGITLVVTVAEGLPSDLLYGSCSAGQGPRWLGTPSILLIIVNLRGWS
jgi:hypothetical protein